MKNQSLFSLLILICFGIAACGTQPEPPTPTLVETTAPPFDQFVDISFKELLRRDPELVTILGISESLGMMDDTLTPLSDAYLHETRMLEIQTLQDLRQYDRSALSKQEQQIYDTYAWYLDDLVRGHEFAYRNYLVSQMIDSPDQVLTQLFRDQQPVHSAEDARQYIHRLGEINKKMKEVVAGLERRREEGVVLPSFLIDWTLSGISPLAIDSPKSTAFYSGLEQKLEPLNNITPEEKQLLLGEAEAVIRDSVQPGFQSLVNELRSLKTSAPRQTGIGSLPDGKDYYAHLLRHHTSSEMSAEEIHRLGLSELEKIQAEMRQVFDTMGYPELESLPELYRRAARDGGIFEGKEVYDAYVRKIDEAKTETASLFSRVPAADVIVQPDPIGGFYMPPAMDGSRPGIFYASTGGSTPGYVIPTLVYHETVPGHHMQLALVGELGMPLFQTVAGFNGYVEGWALYAEKLMAENGVYDHDPYGYLGYLQFAARRAARLVIDTGIHTQGWDMDKATRFMVENTGMGERDSQFEAARMAVMPGQAVSYYIGYLKIMELREKARTALGEKFDQRTFHDLILSLGPVPLSVLEYTVEDFIEAESTR